MIQNKGKHPLLECFPCFIRAKSEGGRSGLILLFNCNALFCDASLLAGEVAQVVELSTTYLTNFVHHDAVDVGTADGENTFNTNCARHLADCEALVIAVTADFDADTTIELNTLLVTFDNFVSNSYSVTSLE